VLISRYNNAPRAKGIEVGVEDQGRHNRRSITQCIFRRGVEKELDAQCHS
jgi:hypothetical protein